MELTRDNTGWAPGYRDANDIFYRDAGDDHVYFNDVALGLLEQQCQYASRYILGLHGAPRLGEGLRFEDTDTHSYYDITLHKDDIDEFVRRKWAAQAFEQHGVRDEKSGEYVSLSEAAVDGLGDYLRSIGADV